MKTTSILNSVLFLLFFGFANLTNAQCTASFSITQGAPGNYSFTSTSTGTSNNTKYYFDFGDGQNSGLQMNPSAAVVYTTNQIYTVSMFLSDSVANCFTNAFQTVTVSNVGCNFSLSINSVSFPNGMVNFSSNVGNQIMSYYWNFGDNTSSTQPAPAHAYAVSGVYTVTLNAVAGGSVCSYSATKTITVSVAPCSLTAGISYASGNQGIVSFSSVSTGTTGMTTYFWDFGDGNYSSLANTANIYNLNNTYSVSLFVTDSASFFCTSSVTAIVTVTNALCQNLSSFNMSKDSTLQLTWNAYPYYPSGISNVIWNWGDGNSTNAMYPSHTYSAAGIYTVCLSSTMSCGTSTTVCLSQSIFKTTQGESAMLTLNVKGGGPTGLVEASESAERIKIYPNPSAGFVKVDAGRENVELMICDLPGKIVYKTIISGAAEIDLHTLQNGIYFIRMQCEGISQYERLVIQH